METRSVRDITLYYDAEEEETAGLIADACEQTAPYLNETWGLATPAECRAYVMTSGARMIFHAAPWPWKIALGITYPFWASRAGRLWRVAGGWAQRFGRRATVGIKPGRLIEAADGRIGQRIFVPNRTLPEKVQHNTCHELTHAFSDHLKLPAWLHEGIAMLAVDEVFETRTIQLETIDALKKMSDGAPPGQTRKLDVRNPDAVVYQVVRGYWFARYIEATRPGLLKKLLAGRREHSELQSMVASAYDVPPPSSGRRWTCAWQRTSSQNRVTEKLTSTHRQGDPMQTTARTQQIIRWAARLLGLGAVGVLFLVLFSNEELSRTTLQEWVLLACFPIGVAVGMVLGWWREGLGAIVAVISLLAFYVIHLAMGEGFPDGPFFLLVTSPALLFAAYWWMRRGASRPQSAG